MDDLGFVPEKTDDGLGFVAEPSFAQKVGTAAFGAARDTFSLPWDFAKTLANDPAKVQKVAGPWLPAAGSALGAAFAPVTGGLSVPVGAGAGEMLRQAGDIAFNQPGAIQAGQNFSPRAGINAAEQTALAGIGEVNALWRAPKAVSQAASELPIVDAAVARGSKTPVALFAGNQDYGEGTKAIYTVYQKGQAVGSSSTLPFDQLPQGVQIIGREARAAGVTPAGAAGITPPDVRPYVQRGVEAAAEKLAPVGDMVKKGVSRLSEAFTGVPARQASKLIDEPGRLVSGIGQLGARGQAVGDAQEALSNHLMSRAGPDLPGTFRLTPELDSAITTNKGGVSDDIVTNLLTKAKNQAAISPDEAVAGIKAIDRTFPNATAKNAEIIKKYSDLRSTLSDIAANSTEGKAAGIGAAKAAYNDARVGADFRNPFRQTKAGKVSAVPFLSFLLNSGNWSTEQLAGQALKLPAFSPAVWGTGMAAGSAAVKAAGAVAGSSIARQALISRYITSRDKSGR